MGWKLFEKNSLIYIKKLLVDYPEISFDLKGESNSTISDIAVFKKNKEKFFIECKLSPSQAAQFVVKNNKEEKRFYDSAGNKGDPRRRVKIIDHMNKNYNYYSEGKNIDLKCSKKVMVNCIKDFMKEKKIKFIISSSHHSDFLKNPIKIINVNNIEKNFDIDGKYRIKRSGTRKIPRLELSNFKKIALKEFGSHRINTDNNGKSFITFSNKYTGGRDIDKDYFLSKKSNFLYEIKKKSSTNNSNIIFSMKLINNIKKDDREQLEKI